MLLSIWLRRSVAGALAVIVASTVAAAQVEEPGPPKIIHRVNPHGIGLSAPTGSTSAASPISYHGGPVIAAPVIYLIWYGNWDQGNGSDTPAGRQIVRDFATNVGSSPYFYINRSYPGVSGAVYVGGETSDAYSRGSRLKDADVQGVVVSAIASQRLPFDANGVYFVLSSSDVSEQSGFCRTYCGWHTAADTSVGHIRYSFVGNANRCLSGCAIQSTSPNANAGVDGMVSVIAHELEEAATDPNLNAWYDGRGAENADKCAWTFGHSQYQVANGSFANVHLGLRDFMIQRNLYHYLVGTSDYCMMDATHN
ncbi:MAG TPA: hypothetical protein VL049_08475 [Candidatus Dormibacteraeota bacterium]|nr:hypothetical protein [Candidatus Dormibacteraeota bacterium]